VASSLTSQRDYTWNQGNEITEIRRDGVTNSYSHDRKGQLVQWTKDSSTTTYSYDVQGNPQLPGSVYGDDNRLLETDSYSYRYDTEGSLIERVSKSDASKMEFSYDQKKRLVEVRKFANGALTDTIKYFYDFCRR
jgi:hypothetical protein